MSDYSYPLMTTLNADGWPIQMPRFCSPKETSGSHCGAITLTEGAIKVIDLLAEQPALMIGNMGTKDEITAAFRAVCRGEDDDLVGDDSLYDGDGNANPIMDLLCAMSHPTFDGMAKKHGGLTECRNTSASGFFRMKPAQLLDIIEALYGEEFALLVCQSSYKQPDGHYLGHGQAEWLREKESVGNCGRRGRRSESACSKRELVGLVRLAMAMKYLQMSAKNKDTTEEMSYSECPVDSDWGLTLEDFGFRDDCFSIAGSGPKVAKEKKAKVVKEKKAKVVKEGEAELAKEVKKVKKVKRVKSGAKEMKVALGAKDVRFLKPMLKKVNDMKNIDEMLEILQARKKELEAAEEEHWATYIQKMYRGFSSRQAREPVPESESDDDEDIYGAGQ